VKKIGVLLSGRGSNFEAIARNCLSGKLQAEIAVVVSNRPEAKGLETAQALGMTIAAIPSKGLQREEHDRKVVEVLREHKVDLVILAGYMRILSGWFIQQFPQKILNIHPALLPAFPGLDAQHQAWEYGVKVSGCTVHFVDEQMDHGPVVKQAIVEVRGEDTSETLAERILAQEHRIYSEAIAYVLEGAFTIEGRRVVDA
jgi:phosphoribosylglycinamide formyltransferase-1